MIKPHRKRPTAVNLGNKKLISSIIRLVCRNKFCKKFENWPSNCNFCFPYKNSETSKKNQERVFSAIFELTQKKIILFTFYESSKTEYSDSTSFINRLTPLIFF